MVKKLKQVTHHNFNDKNQKSKYQFVHLQLFDG